jgi:hypothetical protein
VYLEGKEVAFSSQTPHLESFGCWLALDAPHPMIAALKADHHLVYRQVPRWNEVFEEVGLTGLIERPDLVDDGVPHTTRSWGSHMKVASELSKAVLAEQPHDVRLPPLFLPVHMEIGKVDDAHEDTRSNEPPHLLGTRRPPSRRLLGYGVQIRVGCNGRHQLTGEEALHVAQHRCVVMTGKLGLNGDVVVREVHGSGVPGPRRLRWYVFLPLFFLL